MKVCRYVHFVFWNWGGVVLGGVYCGMGFFPFFLMFPDSVHFVFDSTVRLLYTTDMIIEGSIIK